MPVVRRLLVAGVATALAIGAGIALLGGDAAEASGYENGDRVRLARGVRDLAHEYGCSWTGAGRTAAAWVFAPPVPRGTATDLVREARSERGCEPAPEAPAYGDPSVGLVCTTGRAREVSFRGLFGDAWLACSVRDTDVSAGESAHQAVDRAGRWCVATARAAAAHDGAE